MGAAIDITTEREITVEIIRGGSVSSVNGKKGAVVLDAEDVNADPAGSAAAALTEANTYTDQEVAEVAAATDAALANKADKVRVTSIASSASITLNCATTDHYEITALATNTVFEAPLNPVDGAMKLYRYKDNGNSWTLTLNAIFVDLTGSFPSATTPGKVGMFGARYSAARVKWEIISAITEP